MAAGAVVVSPSDSRLSAFGPIPADGRLEQVKGRTYALEALLGSAEEAPLFPRRRLRDALPQPEHVPPGPRPVDGRIRSWRYQPGRLYPVNERAVRSVDGLFTVNERVAVLLESDAFGPVAVVFVGATNVGRITLVVHATW